MKGKVFGILLIIIGSFIISKYNEKIKEKFKKDISKDKNKYKKWEVYALLGGVSMSIKDIFTKISLGKDKVDMSIYLLYSFIIASAISFVYQKMKIKTLKLIPKNESNKNNNKNKNKNTKYLYILLSSIIVLFYAITVGLSTSLAPNPGLAKAIDILGVVLTLFIKRL